MLRFINYNYRYLNCYTTNIDHILMQIKIYFVIFVLTYLLRGGK